MSHTAEGGDNPSAPRYRHPDRGKLADGAMVGMDGPGRPILHGRLPWYRPEDLDDAQRRVYDAIALGPRASTADRSPLMGPEGRLHGPFNAMLVSPALGMALQSVGRAIRYAGELSARHREIAILVVAAHEHSDFEWAAHLELARAEGLDDEQIDALGREINVPRLDDSDSTVVAVTRALIGPGDVSDPLFEHAAETLGTVRLVELIEIAGHYRALALSLRVLRVPLPEHLE